MPSSFIIPLAFLFAVAAARAEMPTQPADRFADSIGVCTHWSYPDTPYSFAFEGVKQRLVQSGIRQVRDGMGARLVELGKLGIRATVVVDADKPIAESLAAIKKANAEGARIVAIEGPNEPWHRVPLAPPMPATLTLTKPVKHAEVFIPNDSDEIVQTFTNTDTLPLAVPDRVMVVRLRF